MTTHTPTLDAVPAVLREYDQWVGWRAEQRDGNQTKVPINPSSGSFASTTNPETWASFEEALQAITREQADGIGFVFTDDDPFVGVDLDHCRVTATGTIYEWAQDIIDRLESYTEVSPSGTGVHVLVRGPLPEGGNRSGNVELYETARFFTMTGAHLEGTPAEIHERSEQLATVHREHVASDATDETPPPTARQPPNERLDDTELIERAQRAANGEKFTRLWNGSTAGYDSHSEADMALCSMLAFWTGGDDSQTDRLFRDSGLYRGKWDEIHFADGSTYGEKTVERAIAGTSEFYASSQAAEDATETDGSVSADAQALAELRGEVDRLNEVLTRRRETIEALEQHVRSLESANDRLERELEAARTEATTEEPPEDSRSLWDRLRG